MKKFWIKKAVMMFTFFIGAVLLFGLVVMGLWNAILPAVLGVKAISFVQALGILLLSKILFGGFHGRRFGNRHGGGPMWNQQMKEKWTTMTPEDRDKFKSEWKDRCRMWKMRGTSADTPGMKSD